MRRRPTTATFLVAAAVLAAGLLLAAARDHRTTAFSLDVPDNVVAARVPPGDTLCQGPIVARGPFDAVDLWLRPRGRAALEVVALPGRRTLLRDPALALSPTLTGRVSIVLSDRAVPAGRTRTIELCLRNRGRRALAFEGGPPSAISGRLSIRGRRNGNAIAAVFLRPHPPTLLSLLPTVFRRASLFKLQFIGPWAFWALLAGILVAVGLVGAALRTAIDAEDEPERRPGSPR